jgi:D-alanine-D-alanine ligase
MTRKTVAIIFGGRSVEHEVSIMTAHQVVGKIDKEKYKLTEIYIDKSGNWWTGQFLADIQSDKLLSFVKNSKLSSCCLTQGGLKYKKGLILKEEKIDIVLPLIHGTFGEDGTLQGLLEMQAIPYAGCDVKASAIGMDKIIQKSIFEKAGLLVLPYFWFYISEWEKEKTKIIADIERKIGYPFCVKPSSLGSSIGISIVNNRKEFFNSVNVVKYLDQRVLVEKALLDMKEINCSVKGFENNLQASVCEQPIKSEKILSYNDKYLRGGKAKGMASLSRLIPAPISPVLTTKIQTYSKVAFEAIGASGVARIDFMFDNKLKRLYINEINTIPGSLSYYLWEKSGIMFTTLVDNLIEYGFTRQQQKDKLTFSYSPKSI